MGSLDLTKSYPKIISPGSSLEILKKNNTCILTSEMNKMDGNLQSQHRMHWLYFTCCKFGISAYSRDLLIAE